MNMLAAAANRRSAEVRYARASLKRQLGTARSREQAWAAAVRVIADPAPDLQGMRIGQLLEACKNTDIHRVLHVL